MTTEATRARFPWGLTVVCALAFVLLASLGVWQVQRMQWKQALIAQAEAVATAPPVPLYPPRSARPSARVEASAVAPEPQPAATTLQELPKFPEFQRVVVACNWETRGYVRLRSIHEGVAGDRIITLCQQFLVDRGFVPDGATRPITRLYSSEPGGREIAVIAQARTTPLPSPFALAARDGIFYSRDNKAIVKALGGDPGHFGSQVLFAEQSTAPEAPALIAEPPPAAFSNNHLGYALTWFGLALAVLGFYIALLRRKPSLKPSRSEGEASGTKESS
ncbi:SURF1 family protein [Brevundimonas sp.]|uniref:SURF1 family protein n=1 Tax=Brevundimonas sp. TaxID=1871086 RepID=UPI002BC7ABAA|nr:SURF1 family protein [Brevundimonas sp.]HWQ86845.1 SURF1 family protein [Brevundimonas sp.]